MACIVAKEVNGKIFCELRKEECLFNNPDSKSCAEMYGEGPESEKSKSYIDSSIVDDIISDEEGDFESEEDEIENIANGNIFN